MAIVGWGTFFFLEYRRVKKINKTVQKLLNEMEDE